MHSVVLFFLISSCSFFASSDISISAKDSYSLPPLSSSWQRQSSADVDHLFLGPAGASLLIMSFCHEFQAPSLESLAQGTFASLDQARITEQKSFMLQERAALRTQGIGQLDGVPVYLTLVNSKRNNCYYDFLEILPQVKTKSTLDELLLGIRFK